MVTVGVKCICGVLAMDFRSLGSDILKYMFNKWIELGKQIMMFWMSFLLTLKKKPLYCQFRYGCIKFLWVQKSLSLSLSLFLLISFFLMQTQQVAENHTHRYLWNEKVKGIIFISPIPFENFYTLWSNHSYNSCTFKLL